MSNSDIAREVALLLATHEPSVSTGWKWRPGVVLFPESRCPYCKDVIKSKAVWLVKDFYLLGQGVPVAGRPLVIDEPRHPHATPSAICLGDAVDPLQALFNGLNPESAYVNMIEWLNGPYWEHSCAEMETYRSPDEDDEDTFWCESCEDTYDGDDSYSFDGRSYCRDCFNERAVWCERCDSTVPIDEYYTAFGSPYCYDCFHSCFFECVACNDTKRLRDLAYENFDGEKYCTDCATSCSACSKWFSFDDDSGSRCVTCEDALCNECIEAHSCVEV